MTWKDQCYFYKYKAFEEGKLGMTISRHGIQIFRWCFKMPRLSHKHLHVYMPTCAHAFAGDTCVTGICWEWPLQGWQFLGWWLVVDGNPRWDFSLSGLFSINPEVLHWHCQGRDVALLGTSLVIQQLRILLPMQGTQVWSLVQEVRSHMPWGN